MIADVYTAGKDASVLIDTVEFPFSSWRARFLADALMRTKFGNQGKRRMKGLKDVQVTLRGRYDLGAMPFSQGDTITVALKLSSSTIATGDIIVESIEMVADADDTQNPAMIEVSGSEAADWTVTIT